MPENNYRSHMEFIYGKELTDSTYEWAEKVVQDSTPMGSLGVINSLYTSFIGEDSVTTSNSQYGMMVRAYVFPARVLMDVISYHEPEFIMPPSLREYFATKTKYEA